MHGERNHTCCMRFGGRGERTKENIGIDQIGEKSQLNQHMFTQ